MGIHELLGDHRYLLAKAARMLGAPVRAIQLEGELWSLLKVHLKCEARVGLDQPIPLIAVSASRNRKVLLGLERYRLGNGDSAIRFVRVVTPSETTPAYNFLAVPVAHTAVFYRRLRRLQPAPPKQSQPVLCKRDSQRLLANTIGFLKHGRQQLGQYGVPQKRGVLLVGEPGNGKTMTCRWLRSVCRREGLLWRTFTVDDLNELRFRGGVGRRQYSLPRPGIVCFDDINLPLADPKFFESERQLLLSLLDGMHPATGIVFLFTTNMEAEELDPAFRRPGRIDQVVELRRPDETLRRQFIDDVWPANVRREVDFNQIVQQTAGLSFADLAELRTLLVLGQLDRGVWDWDAAWETFASREERLPRQPMGFATSDRPVS